MVTHVCSKKTVQLKSAMAENPKQQILSNDLIRRLLNTSEELGVGARCTVVDQYNQKLLNSGFRREQTRKILLNSIKGYEAKKQRRATEGRSLRSTAQGSRGTIWSFELKVFESIILKLVWSLTISAHSILF